MELPAEKCILRFDRFRADSRERNFNSKLLPARNGRSEYKGRTRCVRAPPFDPAFTQHSSVWIPLVTLSMCFSESASRASSSSHDFHRLRIAQPDGRRTFPRDSRTQSREEHSYPFKIERETAFACSVGRVSVLIVEKVNCLIGLARGLQIAGRPRSIVFVRSVVYGCAHVSQRA